MTTPNYPTTPVSTGATTGSGLTGDTGATSGNGGAKEQAQQTAGTAADETKHVAGVAKSEAQQVASEAKQQARNLLGDAQTQVNEQSRTQRDRLVSTLQDFSSQLDSMASGEGSPSGMAQDLVRQVADRTRDLSSRMDGREPSDLLEDVRSFARRKPGTFLLGAAAAGLLAGRLTRGAKEANSGSSEPSVYDDPRGTADGYPVTGTDYPAADDVYASDTAIPAAGTSPASTTGPATTPVSTLDSTYDRGPV